MSPVRLTFVLRFGIKALAQFLISKKFPFSVGRCLFVTSPGYGVGIAENAEQENTGLKMLAA